MRLFVILPAAGASRRFGPGQSKLDADLAGRPVLQRTVEAFVKRNDVHGVVVAAPHDDEAYEQFRIRHADKLGLMGVTLCRGGVIHRWETVKAALEHVPNDATHIAVHDAARPAVTQPLLDRVLDAAARHPAVIPALEATDTLKKVRTEQAPPEAADPLDAILGGAPDRSDGVDPIEGPGAPAGAQSIRVVDETIDRSSVVLVQTPQVFEADLLRRAYAQDDLSGTDDAGLVERIGERIVVVEGDPRNIKITRPGDVALCKAIMGLRESKERPTHKRF